MKRVIFFRQSQYSPVLLIFSSLIIFFAMSGAVYAGILFTKIDANGNELADDAAADWSCVKHNITGLMWEKKTTANMAYLYDMNGDGNDDASFYVNNVNNVQGICGYYDWRLPTIKELNSITDKTAVNPAIDTDYFPNTSSADYWSNTFFYSNGSTAWAIDFYDAKLWKETPGSENHVRLVRGEQYFDFFNYTKIDAGGNDLLDAAPSWSCVRDNRSGLIWEVKTAANQNIKYSVNGASAYAGQLNSSHLCGYDDWRLPEVDELILIVDYSTGFPAISGGFFPNTESDPYWSASFSAAVTSNAWYTNFVYGSMYYINAGDNNHVRLVSNGHLAPPPPPPSYPFLPAIFYLLN